MQESHDPYFTLWYGVYHPATRRLDYGCAGHPPAVLVDAGAQGAQLLKAKGLPIGLMPDIAYGCERVIVPPDTRLYLFSDGAYEVQRPDGTMMRYEELLQLISDPGAHKSDLDRVFQDLLRMRGDAVLEDDFSIVRFKF